MSYFGSGMNFPNVRQDMQLMQQRRDINRAERAAQRANRETESMVAELERLNLAAAAVWELVSERLDLTDDDLLDKIREIDLRDGAEDGRVRPAPRTCPECDRPNHARRPACLYCGFEVTPPPLG